jgi:diguanylate cyclase (GGDEF)-like protein
MMLREGADPSELTAVGLPDAERLRLAALYRYHILDTAPEPQFDRLVKLAARVFDLPMTLISFIGVDRQWLKAKHGVLYSEVPRCESFGSVAIAQDGVMLVPDATLDPRLQAYAAVRGPPYIRGYAGAPLVTPEGFKIGIFCVFGQEPRTFSKEDVELLESLAAMVMDELKLRRFNMDLNRMAMFDALTGLPNRVKFQQHLAEACRRADASGKKFVLGRLDLDQFKRVNDTFGHAAGDTLLSQVAQRLKEGAAGEDMVARVSGDEFVLLLTDVQSAETASVVAGRLEEKFTAPFLISARQVEVHVRWSLGMSIYPDDARGPDELLSFADAAMYRVKRAGGGHTMFQVHQDQRSPLEVERLSALHRAIEEGELRLDVQPIVHARSHAVIGHEALLRWERPSGTVSPLDFVPLAETCGLMVPIGRWVLKQAVDALQAGQLQQVSVNVSALELRQPDFVPYLRELLEKSGVAPRQLWLELTESILLEPAFAPVLRELLTLGILTALDDFGTGYSSLKALASLPVRLVKIDRSFTAGISERTPAGAKAREVMRGIVTLANAYGLPTVLEGIETPEQAEQLAALGCQYFQGYLFGRPQPLA